MVEFDVLMAAKRACSKLTTLEFRKADFGVFRKLLDKVPWDKVPERIGTQES